MSIARKRSNMKKGDTLFVLGLMLAALEPALILFTIGQTLVGGLAATLWVLFTSLSSDNPETSSRRKRKADNHSIVQV